MTRPAPWIVVAACAPGCGPAAPVAKQPDNLPPPPDAAPALAPDAPPAVPEAVTSAPAWVFGYHTADRSETWTLRHAEGSALLVVETARGTTRYVGTAVDGASLALDVRAPTAQLALDCKREKQAIGTKCNDPKAKQIDVLACYHPDFKTPMPFGPAPGIEYVVDGTCNGYRLIETR